MSRELLNIALAVAAVLLLAAGGAALVERARAPHVSRVAAPAAIPEGARLVTLEVSGITCANCASRITREVEATAGVRSCGMDLKPGRAFAPAPLSAGAPAGAVARLWVLCDRAIADTSLVAAVGRAGAGAGSGSVFAYAARVVSR